MLLVPHLISNFSLKQTFNWSLIAFIAASFLGGALDSLLPIIFCRAIQGIAMGILAVAAIITLFEIYPIEKRGQAGAFFGVGMAIGPTLGPTLSGIIVEWWGWRATFYTPSILAIISLVLCWKALPSKRVDNNTPLDKRGFALLTLITFGFFGSLTYLSDHQWPTRLSVVLLSVITLLTVIWWKQQRRCAHPLLALSLFEYPVFNATSLVSFVYGMGLWGSAFLLPLYLQQSVGMSVWDTGMVMLPSGLFMCLIIPLGGRLADNIAARTVVFIGLLALSCSFLMLGLNVAQSSFIGIALLIVLSRGLGLGMIIPSLDATATRALPSDKMSDGVAMSNFLRQLGGALSPTLLSLFIHWRTTANTLKLNDESLGIKAAYDESLLALALLFALSLIATWKLPNQRFSNTPLASNS